MVSLIQSNYSGFGSGLVPDGAGFMLQNRGALFTLEPNQPNTLAPRKRPLHTIIPGFMEKNGTRIAFGIMGGWNQAQAHAQFVADIADFALTPQEALEAGRFTEEHVHRLRRADRSTRARSHAQRADGARPPAEGRAPARQPVRLGPGHPRAYRRRPFRRLGAPTRWDGASGRAGRVQVIPSASGFRLRGSGRVVFNSKRRKSEDLSGKNPARETASNAGSKPCARTPTFEARSPKPEARSPKPEARTPCPCPRI